jgi:hypothetical protein
VSSSAWVPGFRVRGPMGLSLTMMRSRAHILVACHSPAAGSQMQHALETLPNYHSWQAGSGLKKDCEACKRTNHPSTYRAFLFNLLRVVVGCVLTHGRRYRLELSGPHYDARAYWSGSISVRLPSSPVLAFDCPPLTSPFPAGRHDAYSLLR